MKIIAVTGNHEPGANTATIGMHLLADSALLRTDKPFFLPTNISPLWQVHPGLAVSICRLGKGIAARFANRYITGVTACLVAVPQNSAINRCDVRMNSCDGSVMVGDPVAGIDAGTATVNVQIDNDAEAGTLSGKDMAMSFESLVAEVSRSLTLKTGDLLIDISPHGINVNEGNHIWANLCGKPSLEIRVK